MRRMVRSAGCGLLAAVLVTALIFLPAYGASKKDISTSKERITDNRQKLEEIKNEQSALNTRLEELNGLKSDTADYIAGLDEEQEKLNGSIKSLEAAIEETKEDIRILEEELQEAEAEVAVQKEGMASRIRYMYETDRIGSLERLLESGSLAEMLNQAEYFRKITDFDRNKLGEFRNSVESLESKREELDSELELMNAQEESLQTELAASEQLENEKSAELKAYEQKISNVNEQSRALDTDAEKLKAAIQAEEKKIAEIEAELKRQEEEARKKARNGQAVKNIGDLNFLWPVPSSSRITSIFGQREAPVAGASTSHKGIDIGASSGSKVLASETGTVVIATYSESAGNYIMISHGNGIYTVYMHLKEITAKLNSSVERGEQIGTVGSTGYSTGPHLHFGIRVNGEYIDPQNYVAP